MKGEQGRSRVSKTMAAQLVYSGEKAPFGAYLKFYVRNMCSSMERKFSECFGPKKLRGTDDEVIFQREQLEDKVTQE